MLSAEDIFVHKSRKPPPLPIVGLKSNETDVGLHRSGLPFYTSVTDLLNFDIVKINSTLSKAKWLSDQKLAEVEVKVGSAWLSMGHVVNNKLITTPEETLYLIQTGQMEVTFNELPLSVQRAYEVMLQPNTDLSSDVFRVYSALCKKGYKVTRHSPNKILTNYEWQIRLHTASVKRTQCFGITRKKLKVDEDKYCSKKDVEDSEEVDVLFDVYIPGNKVNKQLVGLPNYRVCVASHKEEVPLPCEIQTLASRFTDRVPLLFAVVFPDFVHFSELLT